MAMIVAQIHRLVKASISLVAVMLKTVAATTAEVTMAAVTTVAAASAVAAATLMKVVCRMVLISMKKPSYVPILFTRME